MSFDLDLHLGSSDNDKKTKEYDLIIIGGGPAGMAAGLYAARYRLKTLLVEKGLPGGQMSITEYVENYPGFTEPILGRDLAKKMEDQAKSFGLEVVRKDVTKIDFSKDLKEIYSYDDYCHCRAKSIIIATGAVPNQLKIPGEEEGIGRGVSYCATCDGPFYRNKKVAVVGGGDTALEEANFLTKYAEKVYIIHRREEFRAAKIAQERVEKNEKIEFVLSSTASRIVMDGDGFVNGIEVHDRKKNEDYVIDVDGVFIFVGYRPNSKLFDGVISTDEKGWILAGQNMETNIPGVFAAGDVRQKNLRQVVTAVGDGALAAFSANRYIENQE